MWSYYSFLVLVLVLMLCSTSSVHSQEVFETTTEYESDTTNMPIRSKYECDISDQAPNLLIFVSVCNCLALKNSAISIHQQMSNESVRWEVEDCLKKVEEVEDKLAVLYDKKSVAKNFTREAELVIAEFKKNDAETLQNLVCQKATAENSIEELELEAKMACEAFRFLLQVVPNVAAELRTKICS